MPDLVYIGTDHKLPQIYNGIGYNVGMEQQQEQPRDIGQSRGQEIAARFFRLKAETGYTSTEKELAAAIDKAVREAITAARDLWEKAY